MGRRNEPIVMLPFRAAESPHPREYQIPPLSISEMGLALPSLDLDHFKTMMQPSRGRSPADYPIGHLECIKRLQQDGHNLAVSSS